jgi:CBS domain-containing protein
MICPDCGHENIPGSDTCMECGQPLSGLHAPETEMERSIDSHPIGALATKRPVAVAPGATVRDVITDMGHHRIGCVLVVEGDHLAGIFTERDALNRVTPDRSAMDRPVSEFMTSPPATVKATDSIAFAMHEMAVKGYRHLPITDDDNHPIAIVSARDVLRLLAVRFADIRS